MARAAQHVPVTMPARKWKRDTVRLGGIRGGTQTRERTQRTHPHPHPRPQALAMGPAEAPALTPCAFSCSLVWLFCVISSTIFCTETEHQTVGATQLHTLTRCTPRHTGAPRVSTQQSARSTCVRACCFRFLCSTNAAATMAAMQHSETTAAMITTEFPAPPSADRACACEKGNARLPILNIVRGDSGPQSRQRRSSVLPADGALRLPGGWEHSSRCPTSPLTWP